MRARLAHGFLVMWQEEAGSDSAVAPAETKTPKAPSRPPMQALYADSPQGPQQPSGWDSSYDKSGAGSALWASLLLEALDAVGLDNLLQLHAELAEVAESQCS